MDLGDVDEQLVVIGHRRLGRGEDLVGLAVAAQLVQRLQQQPGLGDPVDDRGPAKALDRGEVLPVAGEAGGPHQQVRVGRTRRAQAGGGDADASSPAAGAIGLDAGSVLQQQPAAGEGRHAGPEDLAVERVGQAHLLAAALGSHGEEPAAVEQLELVGADDGLQGGQAGRLPNGQDVEAGMPPRAAGRDGWPAARAAGVWSPAGRRAATRPAGRRGAAVEGLEDQLAHQQDVALAGRPDLGHCGGLDRPCSTRWRSVPTARSRSTRSTRRTRARCHSASTCRPGGAVRPHGGHQEQQVGIDQLAQQRRRRDVEQVKVVDEQHQRAPAALVGQHGPISDTIATRSTRSAPMPAGSRASAPVPRPASSWRWPRPRGRAGRRGRDTGRPGGSCPPGGAVDHEAVACAVVEAGREQLELLVPADQWPLEEALGRGTAVRAGAITQTVPGRGRGPGVEWSSPTGPTMGVEMEA